MRRWSVGVGCVLQLVVLVLTSHAQITRGPSLPAGYLPMVDPIVSRTTLCTAATLNTAITAAGSTNGVLWLSPMKGDGTACNWALEANVTIPVTLTLHIPAKVQICPAGGVILTINGPLEGDLHRQIKQTGCAGTLVFGAPTYELRAEWWGSTRNAATLNAAINDIGSSTKSLILDGAWTIGSSVTVPSTLSLVLPVGFSCSSSAAFDVQGPVFDFSHSAKGIASNITVASTAAEQTLSTYTVNGCSLSTHAAIRLVASGNYLNNSGANTQLTLKVKFGGVVVNTFTIAAIEPSATARPWMVESWIQTAGARNALRATGKATIGPAAGVTGQSAVPDAGGLTVQSYHNNMTMDSTGDTVLLVTAQHDTSASTVSVTLGSVFLELLSK